ncbi:MAG TPA: type II secretion system F family protein [Bacillota bacterium]|nr:type II secretion system F family protein [Bacillota bacterium]
MELSFNGIISSLLTLGTVCFLLLSFRKFALPEKNKHLFVYVLGVIGGGFVGALIMGSWQGTVFGGFLGLSGAVISLKKIEDKLLEKRNKQLSDSLLMLSNLLEAGFGLQQAMVTVTRETAFPLRREWEFVLRQMELGVELPSALITVARRLKEEELALVAIALGIQQRKGGSIIKMLTDAAATIQQRMRLASRVRVLTVQGRLTATIVMALPFILVAVQRVLAPELWQSFIQSAQGPGLLFLAAILQLIGSWWVFRLAAPNS